MSVAAIERQKKHTDSKTRGNRNASGPCCCRTTTAITSFISDAEYERLVEMCRAAGQIK